MKVPKARKLPSGAWFIQLRLGGESIPITAGTEKECIRQATLAKAEYRAGKRQPSISEPEDVKEKLPTLSEAIDTYIKGRSNTVSPATIRGYRVVQRNRFKSIMGESLSDITDSDFLAAVNEEATLCGAKTLRNSWSLVRSAVKESTGRIVPDVPLPQVVPNERPFLDAEEIQIFRKAIRGNKYEIPMLLALSSLRCSEIRALRWENVDLKHRRIHVKGSAVYGPDNKLTQKAENKNQGSTRYVPILMDELYDALSEAQQPSGLVADCPHNYLWSAINKVCRENNLPLVGVHGLRHSFASLAYHLQVPEKYTMAIGGWKNDGTMKKIYTHISQSDVKRYEDAFADFFSKNANENANEK